jgi:hypothetical protein
MSDPKFVLHGVEVFDQAVRLTHGIAGMYGWAAAVPLVAKACAAWFRDWLPPRCDINCNCEFNGLRSTCFCPKVMIPLIMAINTFCSRIFLKTNTKGAHKRGKIPKILMKLMQKR